MMKLIHLKVLRDLKGIRTHVAAIVLALSVAMAMFSGLEMGLRSLLATRDNFTSELHLADLEVRLLPEDIRNLPDWSEIAGLEQVETRLLMPGTVTLPDGKTISALTIFLENSTPAINQLRLLDGQPFKTGGNEAIAERSAALYHGVKSGQSLDVHIGEKIYRQDIVGVASSPEFLIVAANPEYFLPEKGSLAIFYTSLQRMYESLGFTMANDLLFTFKPGYDAEQVKAAIFSSLQGRTLERVINKEEHLSRKHIALDYEVFNIFKPAICLVFALMAFVLVLINIDRLIKRQQPEIGALLALGHSARQVVGAYLWAGLLFSVGGMALGTLAAIGFRSAFLAIYAKAHGLAYVEAHLFVDALLLGMLFVFLIAMSSTLLATWPLWRATPLSLLRPRPPAGKRLNHIAKRISDFFKSRPLGFHLGIRNLFRHYRLSLTTVLTVGLALSVSVAYLICLESMGAAIERSFSSQAWDRTASFLYPTLDEDYLQIAEQSQVKQLEPFIRAQGQLISAQRTLDTHILGITPQGSLRGATLSIGRMAQGPGEVVIGEDVSRRLGVTVGDALTLQVRNQKVPVTVVGIKQDVLLGESIVPLTVAQELFELQDQATGVFIQAAPGADLKTLDQALFHLDYVGRVTLREQLIHDFTTVLEDIRKLVILVASIALVVAILFIVANLNMTMVERMGEFATLRALGYDHQTNRQVVLTEAMAQVGVALLLVIPVSYGMAHYLNHMASQAWFSQPAAYPLWTFVLVALGVLLLTPLSLLPGLRLLRTMDLPRFLRARMIE